MAIAQFSGLASGIDSASLIDALIEAREKTNEIRRADIEHLNSENESLEELNTKLLALNDLVDKFRTANGGGVTKKTSSSDATIATASATAAANSSSISLTATSVAAAGTASYNDTYATTTTAFAPNATGTQAIGVDIGTGADLVSINVNVTNATTVEEYVNAFNADPNASSRAVASTINVGTTTTPSYKVVITSLKTGTELGTIAFNIADSVTGFGGNSDLQNRTVQQATDAQFSMSGVSGTITRASNTISDVVSGVTFQLTKAGSVSINVSEDTDTTADQLQEIFDAFNDVVDFVKENDTITRVEDGENATNVFGSLAKTRIDNDFLQSFREAISGAASTTGTSVLSFSDLGISTNRDGTITLDADKFKTAISSDSIGATEVLRSFADTTAGVSGFMYQYTTFDGFIDNAQSSNNDEVQNLNDQIDRLERSSAKVRASLEQQFARLESITAELQTKQASLQAAISGLGG